MTGKQQQYKRDGGKTWRKKANTGEIVLNHVNVRKNRFERDCLSDVGRNEIFRSR